MRISVLLIALSVHTSAYAAEDFPTRPSGFITDTADVLPSLEENLIEDDLLTLRESTGVEIAVVTLETTEGLPIEEIALEVGRRWGVGGEGDRGIVIILAEREREARIEVGYGLEGEIPDIMAKTILEEVMIPEFREGEYGKGIIAGVQALKGRLEQDSKTPRLQDSKQGFQGSKDYFGILFLLFFLLEWLLIILARTKSWWLGGVIGGGVGFGFGLVATWWWAVAVFAVLGLLLDYAVSKNYRKRGRTAWWAGGGWGTGGGFHGGRGGFGGFSGGSFGGGGASARW